MRISQLATETGVSVPTIKFYLREGLLAPGTRTSRTQAVYDDTHARRLRLIRALVDVAGLSLERVRTVIDVIDAPPDNVAALLEQATDTAADEPTPRATSLLAELDWVAPPNSGALAELDRALEALELVDFTIADDQLREIAAGVEHIAAAEIGGVPTDSAEAAVTYSVLGTELVAPVILALRRVAHARQTMERFNPPES